MRVAVFGGMTESQSLWSICQGFRLSGHSVRYVSSVKSVPGKGKIERPGFHAEAIEAMAHSDLMFWWVPKMDCNPGFVRDLRNMNPIPAVYYSFDDPNVIEVDRPKQPAAFEFAVTCCKASEQWYERQGVRAITLYPPVDVALHGGAGPAEEERCDISFVATNTYPREFYPHVLASRSEMVRAVIGCGSVKLYGHWTAGRFSWGKVPYGVAEFKQQFMGWRKYPELPGVYAAAKVNLCSHIRPEGYRYLNQRVLECMASGGFLLTDHVKGIEELFDVGKELDTWRTLPELRQKTLYWLAHEEERAEVAAAGREKALRDYSNTVFAARLLDFIKEKRDGLQGKTT